MALVKKYLSTIIKIDNPINDIFTLELSSDKPFKFKPGQFLHLALDNYDPSTPWPDSRCFSIQTPPNKNTLKITYAVKGNFTGKMASTLKVGQQVWLKLPYGNLFDHINDENKTDCVFIAGGTGITPFLSLFNDESFNEYKNCTLYLGVRDTTHHIYQTEIDEAFKINPFFFCRLVNGPTDGMLDIEKIHTTHGNNPIYFISGPPLMIANFKQYLIKVGVSKDHIVTDDWE